MNNLVDTMNMMINTSPIGVTGQAKQNNLDFRMFNSNGNANALMTSNDMVRVPSMRSPSKDVPANIGYQRG